jgi:hypothetical protein
VQFVSAIEEAVDGAAGLIEVGPVPLPFPDDVDTSGLELLGPPPVTDLSDGIAQSVELYRGLQKSGLLNPQDHGLELSGDTLVDRASLVR